MSSCSASSRRWNRARAAGTLLAAAAGIGLGAVAMAGSITLSDSVRIAKKIVIDGSGVRVVAGRGAGSDQGVDIKIATDYPKHGRFRRGLRESTDAIGNVRLIGPGIVIDADEAGLVRVFADAEVPAGKRIEGDVVAVLGSVTVKGQVAGNVVAVCGSVRLDPGAAVEGDVVAIGGALDQASGATVGGESVSLGFFPIAWGLPTLPVLLIAVLVGWLISLFMGWLVALLFPERLLRIATTASRRTAASFLLGLVSLPLMLFAVMLLFITVIGIPVALLMPLFYVLAVWVGQLAATYVIGCKILRRQLGQHGIMLPLAAGMVFVALFFVVGAVLASPPGFVRTAALFFSLLGVLLVVALSTIGVGAFLLSRMGGRPADIHFRRDPDPVGVPGVAGAAAAPPANLAG